MLNHILKMRLGNDERGMDLVRILGYMELLACGYLRGGRTSCRYLRRCPRGYPRGCPRGYPQKNSEVRRAWGLRISARRADKLQISAQIPAQMPARVPARHGLADAFGGVCEYLRGGV